MRYDRDMSRSNDVGADAAFTVEQLRAVTRDVATALEASGSSAAAGLLRSAAGSATHPAEATLFMREALVGTRDRWEELPAEMSTAASAALAAAKRLAISL